MNIRVYDLIRLFERFFIGWFGTLMFGLTFLNGYFIVFFLNLLFILNFHESPMIFFINLCSWLSKQEVYMKVPLFHELLRPKVINPLQFAICSRQFHLYSILIRYHSAGKFVLSVLVRLMSQKPLL
jgi:hypothetical protein